MTRILSAPLARPISAAATPTVDAQPQARPAIDLSTLGAPKGMGVPPPGKATELTLAELVTRQIRKAGQELGISSAIIERLVTPERLVTVTFDVTLSDGSSQSFTGFRVRHNTAKGPAKGGVRLAPDMSIELARGLAAEMALKTAVADLPLGGGKGGVRMNPKEFSPEDLARVFRGYVRAILEHDFQTHGEVTFGLETDVPAPDVGSSHPDVALMDVGADETIRFAIDKGLATVGKTPIPQALRAVPKVDTATATPLVNRYRDLHKKGEVSDQALLGSFTGKSVENGGSLGRRDATGYGLAFGALELLKYSGALPPTAADFSGQTVSIQGFGNVGMGAARAFVAMGAKVTAIRERDGALMIQGGIQRPEDVEALVAYKQQHGTLKGFPGPDAELAAKCQWVEPVEAFWSLPVDMLVPAAKEKEITAEVANILGARYVLEGANGPTTPEADAILEKRGIDPLPDILANTGGVTVSFYEMEQNARGEQWTEAEVNQKLQERIKTRFEALAEARGKTNSLRRAALHIGIESLAKATAATAPA